MFSKAKSTHHLITGSAKLKILEHCRTLLHTIKMQWPPSSPDLNPPDYSVLATLEAEACKTPKSSFAHLKVTIKTVWDKMTTNHIIDTCAPFSSHVEKVMRQKEPILHRICLQMFFVDISVVCHRKRSNCWNKLQTKSKCDFFVTTLYFLVPRLHVCHTYHQWCMP